MCQVISYCYILLLDCLKPECISSLLCRTKHIPETSIIFVTVTFVYLSTCLIVALCFVVLSPFHVQEAVLYRNFCVFFYFACPSQVVVIDKLCTFISLIFNLTSLYMCSAFEITFYIYLAL